jgi:hypothetical protein
MNNTKKHLENIVNWLNENYNQDSDKYCIINGPKPEVVRYDKETAISLWSCGAIICIGSLLYFISEDDGNWFIRESERDYGFQSTFSIGWAESFIKALKKLIEYTKENGKPVYYEGIKEKIICHYSL